MRDLSPTTEEIGNARPFAVLTACGGGVILA
jgi:hypothetical protein